jgi:NADPH2:quinone reductase
VPRAVRIHELGGPQGLRVDEVPVQEPGAGEVRIQVEVAALNRADVLICEGRYAINPALPSRIGFECAGTVDAVGAGVTHVRPGDRVHNMPESRYLGGYGESFVAPAHCVTRSPEGWSAREAAAAWLQYYTAAGALIELGGMTADDVVVVTAASSSAGLGAIQIVKDAGAKCIATTRTRAKRDRILAIGADEVIVTQEEELGERILELTGGKGARLLYDAVGGDTTRHLAVGGAQHAQIFLYGVLESNVGHAPMREMADKSITLRGYHAGVLSTQPAIHARLMRYVEQRMAAGNLRPIVDEARFGLDQAGDAMAYMIGGTQFGKVVLDI